MKLRQRIDKILGIALIVIMAVMVINVLWQVFTRYLSGNPSSFTDELARYLMIWIGILGAAYVSGRNNHVAITLLPSKLSEAKQKVLRAIVDFIIMAFALVAFVIGGIRLVYINFVLGQESPALQIPIAYVYLVIPISGILIIYFKISDRLNA